MNLRGQAALEYLMTYGWALVIIVIVVGILFLVALTPSGGVTCQSNDPAKIPMKSSNILSTDTTSEIRLINGTGGKITVTGAAATAPFAVTGIAGGATVNTALMLATGMTKEVIAGVDMVIVPDYGTTWAITENKTGTYTITYTDPFSYTKTVTVTCTGTPKT